MVSFIDFLFCTKMVLVQRFLLYNEYKSTMCIPFSATTGSLVERTNILYQIACMKGGKK